MLTLAANHLWQSTGFAAAAALLAVVLRGNHARVRYWLWLAASVKFLIPFSALIWIGGGLERWLRRTAPVSRLPMAPWSMMQQIVQPFAPIQDARLSAASVAHAPPMSGLWLPLLFALWLCGFLAVLLYGVLRWRRVGVVLRAATPITEGRELEALRRVQRTGISKLPRLVSSNAKLEPGVFGIFRTILWLPAGIADHLDGAELESILAHELCHIRRRDSLTALIHMAVEAIFWFHPLVWWLGARLTEERERACDEEVLQRGGEPRVYAESILKVCEIYLASPIACAAGISGGELKKRIEGIMMNRFARNLSLGKKLMLAAGAVAAVIGPMAFGIVSARAQAAPRPDLHFDVVSVRIEHHSTGGAWDEYPVNGRWTSKGMEIPAMIAQAYGVSFNRVEGIPKALMGPDPGFTILAKMPIATTREQFRLMMQSLLADRFKAVLHTEVRDIPANTIEVAKGGVKMEPAGECVKVEGNASVPDGQHRCHDIQISVYGSQDGTIHWEYAGWSVSMADLAARLSPRFPAGLMVDDTGLTRLYDFDVKIAMHPAQDEFDTAWQYDWRDAWEKQAGLLIDVSKTKKRPATVVVVDHVELPTPN